MNSTITQLVQEIQEHIKEEQFLEALEKCNVALRTASNGTLFHLQGICLYYLGRYSEAIFSFGKATQQEEASFESWSHLALLHLELLELEQAKIALHRATQLAPNYAYNWALRSIYREWVQDFIGAERAYLHANWLEPSLIPLLPQFQEEETEAAIIRIIHSQGYEEEIVREAFSIQFNKAPTIKQLTENLDYISPLHLSFHFEQQVQRGLLLGFTQNILRGIVEDVSLEEQLDPILPLLIDYLETWYQRQP